jgi:hypothetical protein
MKPVLVMITAFWWGALGEQDRMAGRFAPARRRLKRALATLRRGGCADGTLAIGFWNTLGIVRPRTRTAGLSSWRAVTCARTT